VVNFQLAPIAPARQGLKGQEQSAHTVAPILVVVALYGTRWPALGVRTSSSNCFVPGRQVSLTVREMFPELGTMLQQPAQS
jgi:hypothetical protein